MESLKLDIDSLKLKQVSKKDETSENNNFKRQTCSLKVKIPITDTIIETEELEPTPTKSTKINLGNRKHSTIKQINELLKWKKETTTSNNSTNNANNPQMEISTRIIKPNDYLFFSIFSSIFCFLPLGKLKFWIFYNRYFV